MGDGEGKESAKGNILTSPTRTIPHIQPYSPPSQLYLDAWTYAAGLLSADAAASSSAAKAGAPRALLALIPNWSAHAFVNFVDDIAALVDELEVEKQAGMHSRLVDVWKTVLWYEERFWRAGGGDV